MGEFILILLFMTGGSAATSILFPSQQACEAAKEIALEAFKRTNDPRAVCVPRHGQ